MRIETPSERDAGIRVYGPPWDVRIAMFAVAAGILEMWASLVFPFPTHGPLLGLFLILFLPMGLLFGWMACAIVIRFTSSTAVGPAWIEGRGPFGAARLERDHIRGYRFAAGRGGPVAIRFETDIPGRRWMRFGLFDQDETLGGWTDGLTNLDPSEQSAIPQRPKGAPLQDRHAEDVPGWGVAARLAAACFIVVVMPFMFAVSTPQGDTLTPSSYAALSIVIGLICGAAMAVEFAILDDRVERLFGIAIVCLIVCPLGSLLAGKALANANKIFDATPPAKFETTVISKREIHGKGGHWLLKVKPWGPVKRIDEIDVPKPLYDAATPGARVCMASYRGAFGVPWIAACRLPN